MDKLTAPRREALTALAHQNAHMYARPYAERFPVYFLDRVMTVHNRVAEWLSWKGYIAYYAERGRDGEEWRITEAGRAAIQGQSR